MTYDGLHGFSVNYNNPLNLPQTISKGSESISYIYSAKGEKLAKQMKDNSWQYYAGGFVYNSDKSLNYFIFDEGRVKNVSGGLSYEYHLKDHLGNTRVAFEPNGSSTNTRQVAEYYPFGSSFVPSSPNNDNKYLYNGKEKQDDVLDSTNLDWYDYGARFYDPQIGRWASIDPLANKYYWYSPYCYVLNNPLKFVDNDGRLVEFAPNASQAFKDKFVATVKYMNEKGTSGFLKSLNDSKKVYYIKETTGEVNSYTSDDNTILWNPNLAKLTTEGIILSPATLLNHEFDHANQSDKFPDKYENDVNTPDPNYDNKEEKRVIEGSEQKTATKHGEIMKGQVTRKDHKKIGVIPVKDPTSAGTQYNIEAIKKSVKNEEK